MKTIVHHKGVTEAYEPDSEECQELQRSYNRTWGLENQSCLSRSDLWARLEKNLSRVEDAWPEDEDERKTLPVREKDTPRQPDTHVNKIFLTTRILRGHLSVSACRNNWRTAEVPKFEKILTALEQFFVKNQITLEKDRLFNGQIRNEMWANEERLGGRGLEVSTENSLRSGTATSKAVLECDI